MHVFAKDVITRFTVEQLRAQPWVFAVTSVDKGAINIQEPVSNTFHLSPTVERLFVWVNAKKHECRAEPPTISLLLRTRAYRIACAGSVLYTANILPYSALPKSLQILCSGRYILPCCLSPLYPEPCASLFPVQYCSTVGRSSFRLTKGMVRLAHVAAGSLAQGSRSRVALTRPEKTPGSKREKKLSLFRGSAARPHRGKKTGILRAHESYRVPRRAALARPPPLYFPPGFDKDVTR